MTPTSDPAPARTPTGAPRLAPLYLAGFTTAFGAHGIAAALGAETEDIGWTLWVFGLTLALYDLAEVLLKPLFGALSDRIGVRPVIIGGLLAFAAFSVVGAAGSGMAALVIARFGQGAAASAFSPASSAAVARLADDSTRGTYFGRYGSWKSLGYALGPLLGALLVVWGGMPALFWSLAALGVVAAAWVAVAVTAVPVLPRTRVTVADLARELSAPGFLVPTLVLAATTGALAVAVGFLPLLGRLSGLGTVGSMAIVTVLAVASSVVQPVVGAAHDRGRISVPLGAGGGLALIAAGLGAVAASAHPAVLVAAAVLVGAGVGVATPVAFAHLAASTPADRMGPDDGERGARARARGCRRPSGRGSRGDGIRSGNQHRGGGRAHARRRRSRTGGAAALDCRALIDPGIRLPPSAELMPSYHLLLTSVLAFKSRVHEAGTRRSASADQNRHIQNRHVTTDRGVIMTKVFVNLPTSDLERSKAFYTAIGCEINPLFTDENAACVVWSDDIYFMVLKTEFFATFTDKPIADPNAVCQVSVSFAQDSREDVDAIVEKALAAGGTEPKPAQDYGFMYSRDIDDPDGNSLGFLYMTPEVVENGPEHVAEAH